jgi:cell wall assembly regulator SMI1
MIELWSRIEEKLNSKSTSLTQVLSEPALPNENLSHLLGFNSGILDLNDSLQVHDGQKHGLLPLVEPWILLKSKQIIEQRNRLIKLFLDSNNFDIDAEVETIGFVKPDVWNRNWIPFAADGAGNFLCVDCDPDKGGEIGQVILWASDPPYVEVIAPSYRAWLEQFVSDLEAGKFKWDTENDEWFRVDS